MVPTSLPAPLATLAPLLVILAASPAVAGPGDSSAVARSPVAPSWLADVEPALSFVNLSERKGAGYYQLLYEQQIRVTDEAHQQWVHRAMKVLSPAGASDLGTIEIEYRPGDEKLTLRQITIHRDGRRISRLKDARVTEAQRQSELAANILDDTVTALVLVPDVRVGDVVEYAFTRDIDNPLMRGHASLYFPLEVGGPIAHVYARLLWSADRPFRTRTHVAEIEPKKRSLPSGDEMVWERHNVGIEPIEPYTPRDVFATPWVEVSDFGSWEDVVEWALPLYRRERTREIRELARGFKRDQDTVRGRALAALRFVQDEIRYLGLEWGIHSHAPHSPGEVLERRYGDCKDKVLLLLSLFDELGIEAAPALVDTDDGPSVAKLLPSPYAFDHAIVWANVPGLGEVWVDPTSTDEGGSIDDAAVYYGRALIVRPGETGLAVVPTPPVEKIEVDIEEAFDLKARLLTVTSTYRGPEADSKRSYFRSTPMDEVVGHYLDFYAEEIAPFEVEMISDPTISDDRDANVLVVNERYRLLGHRPESIAVRAHTIATYLGQPPPEPEREQPFHLGGAIWVRHQIRFSDWETPPWQDVDFRIKGPAVAMDVDHRVVDGTAVMEWELRRATDRIPPGQVEEYMRIWDQIDAELTVVPTEDNNVVDTGVVAAIMESPTAADDQPSGASGRLLWLWLVGAALTLAAAVYFFARRWRRSTEREVGEGIGESALTALSVRSLAEIPWARLRPCACGNRLSPDLSGETTTARLGEEELTVLRFTCERCRKDVVRYLALIEESGERPRIQA